MKKIILLAFVSATLLAPMARAQDESIRDKVEEKIENALQNPKAYIGTVTDIGEASLQLSKFTLGAKVNGDILQVKTSEDTSIVKTTKTSVSIDFDEIAIGDFVTAMGHVNDKEILDTARIIVSTPLTASTRTAIYGTITEVSSSSLTISTTEEELIVDPVRGADYTQKDEEGEIAKINFSVFEEGDIVIVSGSLDEDTLDTRIIHLVSSIQIEESSEE